MQIVFITTSTYHLLLFHYYGFPRRPSVFYSILNHHHHHHNHHHYHHHHHHQHFSTPVLLSASWSLTSYMSLVLHHISLSHPKITSPHIKGLCYLPITFLTIHKPLLLHVQINAFEYFYF